MKTCLVSLCYLDGTDPLGNNRLQRNKRWLEYVFSIKEHLGFDEVYLIDNYSSWNSLVDLREFLRIKSIRQFVRFHSFSSHLTREPGEHNYPYIWRGTWWIRNIIEQGVYQKLILMDSDAFVLSQRLARFIKEHHTGWECLTLPEHGHSPANELSILNQDAYPVFLEYTKESWRKKVGLHHETDLPFTHRNKDYTCDRYGERRLAQARGMDAYFQASLDIDLKFEIPLPELKEHQAS